MEEAIEQQKGGGSTRLGGNKKSFPNVSDVTGNSRIKMEGVCKTR